MSGILNILSPSLSMPRVGPNHQDGGLVDNMMPQGYQDGGPVGNYGTSTDPLQSLRQMGMEAEADDPRLKDYMEDLPKFTMGYTQKLGDITAGGRSGLLGIGQQARTQQDTTGFAGGGAGAIGQAQSRKELERGVATGRRGVVEGYQADLLSALDRIQDEAGITFGEQAPYKGVEEEYGAPAGWPSGEAYQQWLDAGGDANNATMYGWQATEPGATPGYKP